jgi:hypothetical protein
VEYFTVCRDGNTDLRLPMLLFCTDNEKAGSQKNKNTIFFITLKILILSKLSNILGIKTGYEQPFSLLVNQFIHLSFWRACIITRLLPIFAIPF